MILPEKLKIGDEIRIIAPSRSMGILSNELRDIANKRLSDLGYVVTFGKNTSELDDFRSSAIQSRVDDLHNAFLDQNVKCVLTAIGGFNANQMLDHIDWSIISSNPKIFCGYSDITILNNAIYAKTGLITYSGPHYSTFGQKLYFDYTQEYFIKCCIDNGSFDVKASPSWSDDAWYKDQEKRQLIENTSFQIINPGKAEGIIIGANLCTLNLLQGTQYMPDLNGSILFIEDDAHADGTDVYEFDRNLQSIIHLPNFKGVKGIVIGRFQKAAKMTDNLLIKIIKSKKELNDIPVIAGIDFGHTDPKITFPIGGIASLDTENSSILSIINH